jgi:hypothetical protein
MTADSLEVRIAHLEGQVQGLRAEVRDFRAELMGEIKMLRTESGVETKRLDGELKALRTELLARMDRQFFWLAGLILASIASRFLGR